MSWYSAGVDLPGFCSSYPAGPIETRSYAVLKRGGHYQLILNENASPFRIITGYGLSGALIGGTLELRLVLSKAYCASLTKIDVLQIS